jgi:hypothetical protein
MKIETLISALVDRNRPRPLIPFVAVRRGGMWHIGPHTGRTLAQAYRRWYDARSN